MVKKKRATSARKKVGPPGSAGSPAKKKRRHGPPETAERRQGDKSPELPAFPIVAIGASAGGLEAATQLLENLPAHPGVAIVVVQHLSPKVPSLLPELLASHSKMPVRQITDETQLKPDHVYVIPPDRQMAIFDGHVQLKARPTDRSQYTPIDYFFNSVAEHVQSRGIGVILSGSASDGANGMRAIKAAGGITIVQTPETAKYDSMPRASIATQMVDLVLDPSAIAKEIVRIVEHPYVRDAVVESRSHEVVEDDELLRRLFLMLRGATGVDFTHYKLPTIRRRLQRRMVLQKINRIEHYLKFLEENPAELNSLYQDILIHVTRFFREPDSFAALKDHIFPQLLESRQQDAPIRIWVPGCSTGEEPYSVAMTLLELLEERVASTPIQIFATDLSEAAIERARSGVYPESISADVSPERLRRFFTRTDGNYQISKVVRDLCVFARQDLTRDPPFSKLDLIVCRNVLIYLGPVLQKKLMTLFHYALRPSGFLMLGHAETVGVHAELFAIANKKHRVYSRKSVETPSMAMAPNYKLPRMEPARRAAGESQDSNAAQREANRILLERYTPASVVVDSDLQILQFRGHTGVFLEPASGDASLNLLKMAREGLVYGLRSALRAARKGNSPVQRDKLRIKRDGHSIDVEVEVVPLGPPNEQRQFLILFREGADGSQRKPRPAKRPTKEQSTTDGRESEITRLQEEVAASREYLQSIIQDLEAANEELQSANEEIMSSNEELQSTNEELDTAKEELQSTNEELNTLNEELHGRNEELSRVNSDLVNLLASVQIAIVIVSGDLRIRRFTPMAEKTLNLIATDLGRPIGHIKPNIDCPDLEQLVAEAIDLIAIREREVRDRQGHWYSLRIRPYKDLQNRIDGAVLALFDITEAKQHQAMEAEARAYADTLLDTIREPVILLDQTLRVRRINQAFREQFGQATESDIGRPLVEFMNGQWKGPELKQILEKAVQDREPLQAVELSHTLSQLGTRRIRINARWFEDREKIGVISLALQNEPA